MPVALPPEKPPPPVPSKRPFQSFIGMPIADFYLITSGWMGDGGGDAAGAVGGVESRGVDCGVGESDGGETFAGACWYGAEEKVFGTDFGWWGRAASGPCAWSTTAITMVTRKVRDFMA